MTFLRTSFAAALCAAAATAVSYAQATPAASAPAPYSQFALPDVGGSLRYALSASESVLTGYNGNSGSGVSKVSIAAIARSSVLDQRRYRVVFATPARAATDSIDIAR